MKPKSLTDDSIIRINKMMCNQTIADKVKSMGKEGKSYQIYTVENDGIVVLGETKCRFWNRLIGCQFKLPFEAFSTAVWDALVDLSTGKNQEAIIRGLSKEIIIQAQREKRYDWVVRRLEDCYDHVCNLVEGNQSLEGDPGKSGQNDSATIFTSGNQPVNVNVNFDGHKRTFRFPDSMGAADLVIEMGVTGVHSEKR